MQRKWINTFKVLLFLVFLIGNKQIAQSSFTSSSDLGAIGVVNGAYILVSKTCANGSLIKVDPDTRLKMQLIVKPEKTYFFRRMDSKCTYLQYANFRNLGSNKRSISMGKSQKIGNCYFKPVSLIARPLTVRTVFTRIKGKELNISWNENPSLKECDGMRVTWTFKRLKTYQSKSPARLASNPMYGTL